jgi:hypothetical protein
MGTFDRSQSSVQDSAEAIEAEKQAVMARHEAMGFSPQEIFARLGIKADLATYRQVDA